MSLLLCSHCAYASVKVNQKTIFKSTHSPQSLNANNSLLSELAYHVKDESKVSNLNQMDIGAII